MNRVATCLENLEMSRNLTAIRELVRNLSGIFLKVREMSRKCQGRNLVREKWPKAFYC